MAQTFADNGIRFRYPDDWALERQDEDTGWTVTVQGTGTAFALVSVREDMPTLDEVAETALDALREEYPDLEAEERIETVAGQMAIGHDLNFFSLDLPITCWTRSFYSDAGTVLVMCQTTDLELEACGPILKAICASLEVEEEPS